MPLLFTESAAAWQSTRVLLKVCTVQEVDCNVWLDLQELQARNLAEAKAAAVEPQLETDGYRSDDDGSSGGDPCACIPSRPPAPEQCSLAGGSML